MCGIVGEMAFSSNASGVVGEELVSRLVDLMARRGPDDVGMWSDGRRCTLGFRRLAILDLSSYANQPMLTRDGRYALVYNGEVYNYRELRGELERDGVHFHSSGDTEVVLQALVHWGTKALERFNGMFALALYDTVAKRILLARDHAGIKPLYFMVTSEGLVFGSQFDQILAHPWSKQLGVSSDALGLYLRFGYIPSPQALLERTQMLEPGSWIQIDVKNQVERGKSFEFDTYRVPDLAGEQAFEAVDAAVSSAVRRQLVSDVPVGVFLSGGIDSPLVTAKMRSIVAGDLPAFTIGTNGDPLDESTDAAIYASEIGVSHVLEHIVPDAALDMLTDVVSACGEPLADYSMFPTLLVSRLARQQVKVALSGDGGDELFWGYVHRFASMLATTDDFVGASNLDPESAALGEQKSGRKLRNLIEAGSKNKNAAWPANLGEVHRLKHTHIPEGQLRSIFPDLQDWTDAHPLFNYDGWQTDRTAQWLRWNEFSGFLKMVLLKVDRASMYNSLEVRVPMLDKEVIEIATRIDWKSCLDMKQRIGKLPLRNSLARHVRHRTLSKRGFTVPMDAWLRAPLKSIFEETVLGRTDIAGLPMNRMAVRAMFDRHLAGDSSQTMGLWILLSLTLWQERHYR